MSGNQSGGKDNRRIQIKRRRQVRKEREEKEKREADVTDMKTKGNL